MEKAGVTTVTDVERPKPWASEERCQRKDCVACQGRALVAAEKEEEAMDRITEKVEEGKVVIPKKEQVSLPGCTRDGILYFLD